MQKISIFFFILFFISVKISDEINAQTNSINLLWNKGEKVKYELVENIPDYDSLINWTTGKVISQIDNLMSESPVNYGRYVDNNYSEVRDELRQKLIKAMGYVRISDIFLLKDYYTMKSDVRYEIIAHADRAFYYPAIQQSGHFLGLVELNLYGKEGIAGIFYRDIEKVALTNYVQKDSKNMEYFDGLIIDTMTYKEFNPSIQMRIYDEDGILLYGPETVDKDALENYGVCEYTTSLSYAYNSPRSGTHIFYTIPYSITGRMNTYLVLNKKDAARLFANPRTVKFLNQSRVVIVKSPQ